MPGRIGVHPQRFLGIVEAVFQQPGTKDERSLMLNIELFGRRHGEVQMQLLRPWTLRPCRLRQLGYLLEGKSVMASGIP
jgi:hypothetical protein